MMKISESKEDIQLKQGWKTKNIPNTDFNSH